MVALVLAIALSACASSRLDPAADPLGGGAAAGSETSVRAGGAPSMDPRCVAARQALLRPAVWSDVRTGPLPAEQAQLLDQARPLATGDPAKDLDWVLDLVRGFVARPAPLSDATTRELHQRLDRLAVWTTQTCPSAERVWACSSRALYPRVADSVGFIEDLEPISALDALHEWYGEAVGEPEEVQRTDNQVVYAWLDERGMAVRRAEVHRTGAFWAVVSVTGCAADGNDPEWPEAYSTSVDVEGPDLDDYLALLPMVPRPPAGVPPPACGFDPYDLTDAFTSLREYVASGHAEAGCLNWLSPAGWVCLRNPATTDRLGCFDLDPILPPPTTTTTTSVPGGPTTSTSTPPARPTPTTRPGPARPGASPAGAGVGKAADARQADPAP